MVKAELIYGARNSKRVAENLAALERFFAPFASHVFDDRAAQDYGKIRADLKTEGQMIGGNDLMIASIARANDFSLTTYNAKEFQRVVGLRVTDWE